MVSVLKRNLHPVAICRHYATSLQPQKNIHRCNPCHTNLQIQSVAIISTTLTALVNDLHSFLRRQHSESLGFWTSSTVRNSKELEITMFRRLDKFSSSDKGRKAPNLLGPLEGSNLIHWTTHVKVKVTLRLTVSQSVGMSWCRIRCLSLFDDYCCVFEGALSDERSGLSAVRVCII
jgi:hypothetical protein